jgi:nicotinic acid mononucleotide adenylyltransferase
MPAAEPTRYTLVCSGTYNPPHRGHALTGLHAAARLAARGHRIERLVFLPVHDNYLLNKLAAREASAGSSTGDGAAAPSASLGAASDAPHFPMSARCELLALLVETELARLPASVRMVVGEVSVLPYEQTHADLLMQDSPNYWGRILPGGYLRTVPTARLIRALASDGRLLAAGARLGLVFGSDNLAGMAKWESPAQLLASSDLVLVARGQPVGAGGAGAVSGRDVLDLGGEGMLSLLGAVVGVDADANVDVGRPDGFEVEGGGEMLAAGGGTESAQAWDVVVGEHPAPDGEGERAGIGAPSRVRLRRRGGGSAGGASSSCGAGGGSSAHATSASPDGTVGTVLYALSAPCSSVRHLSSTAMRAALATLSEHGYGDLPLLLGPRAAAELRNEFSFGTGGQDGPPEISELQPRNEEMTPEGPVGVGQAARGTERPVGGDAGAPLGGLIGGWVGGGLRLWERVYGDAVRRGELARGGGAEG